MPLTYDQRLELLKKAREAKKNKKLAKESAKESLSPTHAPQEQDEEPETPKISRSRSKSVKPTSRTLDIKEPEPLPDFIDSEPEVEEQIIYKPKEKKKKKIIRRVIMERSSDEEEVEVIEERVKAPKKEKAVKQEITPKAEPEVKPNNPFFNF